MIIQRRLNPGAPGTKKYVEKYGDRLVCVRYKYYESSGIKTKTIELVESESPWQKRPHIPVNKSVYVRIDIEEKQLQHLIRAAGGHWDRSKQRWRLPYGTARSLGLDDRIDWSS